MSKYTTEIRFICESKSGFTPDQLPNKTIDEIITAARPNIFNFSYPIYESGHKPTLETKILKHYYTREIGAETYGLWHTWLNDTLNLIMPKYNKLYQQEALILNKELNNIDVTSVTEREDDFTRTDNLTDATDMTRTDNLTDSTDMTRTDNLHDATDMTRTDNLAHSNSGSTTTADKYSDTPQGTNANVDNDTYLTDYRKITGTTSDSGTNTGTERNAGTVDHTGTERNAGTVNHTGTERNAGTLQHTGTQRNAGTQDVTVTESGYRGSKTYYELIADYKDRILNIDQMIVMELSDLFFKLW